MTLLKNPLKRIKDLTNYPSTTSADSKTPSKTEGININPPSRASSTTKDFLIQNSIYNHSKINHKEVSNNNRFKESENKNSHKIRDKEIIRTLDISQDQQPASESIIEERESIKNEAVECDRLYRSLSMNMSKSWNLETQLNGEVLSFRARIHTLRRLSSKMVFIIFRQQTITIQGILKSFGQPNNSQMNSNHKDSTEFISEKMVRYIEHLPSETLVLVRAKLREAPNRVINVTIHNYEFEVFEIHKIGNLSENVPFSVYDVENACRDRENDEKDEKDDEDDSLIDFGECDTRHISSTSTTSNEKFYSRSPAASRFRQTSIKKSRKSSEIYNKGNRSLSQRVRLDNRIIDLRTGPSQSIFRIQSGICNLFRSYLNAEGFLEVHTPKIQRGATESGASVFKVNYFGRPAFLAQSPQLAKQMCISADFERVYEIGPVFRAEDSNTPRHLTEFTGLDLEMTIEEHYYEALNIIDSMLKNIWKELYQRYQSEIDIISQFYRHDKILWLDKTFHISFYDGIKMLEEDGWTESNGTLPLSTEDLSTRAEARLGTLIREKYKTDYYILDKFPASARPFYTMPDPKDDRLTNSFDIFLRGQEIISGGQRIHDTEFLIKQMKRKGVRSDSMPDYMQGFRWGVPPHAGCGIGLERLTSLFLNLGNIRLASIFPLDPKSFPEKPQAIKLRHEEASTVNLPWGEHDLNEIGSLQPLEKLIANYGDAANTTWLGDLYHVWRHPNSGAAQGYVINNGYAIVIGDPLCDKSQYLQVVSSFLQFIRGRKDLKPIWIIAGPITEEILAEKHMWKTIGCIAEERINPRNNPALKNKDLARKIRHAHNEGVREFKLIKSQPMYEDIRTKIGYRIQEWYKSRKGTQVHLTQIRPWIDQEHRRYFYSQTGDGIIHALVVLHQLSPANGYQIKISLEFPDAPSGTIESLIMFSMKSIVAEDPEAEQATFGTGALPTVRGGRNIGNFKLKALKKVYGKLYQKLKLDNKSEFREKMGVWSDPVYVCYPSGGLGPFGIKAIMGFLGAE
ncbi:Aspartate--tRNA ligase, cytoplasmic [Erysiphe neolycopersici]|uniref:Probable aspartate--tRNA ligase, cytoplasmic n=1 Tax=Erysiphe neolycopersici TaxID=212602 RepID=A0A420HWD6_9PEZI|nr:Aspartate--tRNA ligase, cytoplasmic [Erysiphe neolycopersici]